ncbi:MAG: hypothetical protein AB8G77_27505 [Rhodothermales bacterium]
MSDQKTATVFKELYHEIVEDSSNPYIKKQIFRTLRRLGFLGKIAKYRKHRPMYYGFFWGDLPIGGAKNLIMGSDSSEDSTLTRRFVVATDYETPSEDLDVEHVTYTPNGFAWRGRTLDQSISVVAVRNPKRFLKEIPRRPSLHLAEGTLIQAQTPFTYGDWVPEHRNSIIAAKEFPLPLVLPNWIGRRPYVQKELSDLGIDYLVINSSVHIKKARVLRKKHVLNLLLSDDIKAYRTAFKAPAPKPKHGKIVYLSRGSFSRTIKTEGRHYPSNTIGKIVNELGGKVVETNGKDRDYYREIAAEADIVIADHGGAMFNLMEWRPHTVIEIVEDGWWNQCFVFLSAACGVKYHGIIRSTQRSEDEIRLQITQHIENAATKKEFPTIQKISLEEAIRL